MINKDVKDNFNEATKNILEKNLKILEKPFCENKIVLVYDEDSKLSKILWESYRNSLEKYSELEIEIIIFWDIEKEILKEKLMSLEPDSTVVLVQATNFRLDNFRLRFKFKKCLNLMYWT